MFSVQLNNSDHYARLVRIRTEWEGEVDARSNLLLYDDNYLDLAPNESRTVHAILPLTGDTVQQLTGKLYVQGTNLAPVEIPLRLAGNR